MENHVKLLAAVSIVFGALGLFAGIVVFALLGGAASIVGLTAASQDPDALVAVPILGVLAVVVSTLIAILSLPSLIMGLGLLKYRNWARILGIVISVLNLLNFPIGTAIGVYGLWVLFQPETEKLFRETAGNVN